MNNKKVTITLLSAGLLSVAMILVPTVTRSGVVHADSVTQTPTAYAGTWGTAAWNFDTSTGVLNIESSGGATLENGTAPWYTHTSSLKTTIKKIVFTGKTFAPVDSQYLFSDLTNLISFDGLNNLDTSQVSNMSSMFAGDTALTSLDVSKFDTSNVTNMSGMFSRTSSLSHLDVSNFKTSNVTSIRNMFFGDSRLTSLDVSKWYTSLISNMGFVFYGSGLKSVDVSNFKTSNVTDMTNMFGNMPNLQNLNLTSFDTSKIVNAADMFANTPLSQLTLGGNFAFKEDMALPEPPTTTTTGKWQNIGVGTITNPKGNILWTSSQLISNYRGVAADTFVWQKKAGASITVKYIDDKGKTIAPNVTLSGYLGDPYTATKKSISGYTFSKVTGNTIGSLTDTAQTITFVYKKKATPDPKPIPQVKYQVVYRLYNKNTGEHFYTESRFERDILDKEGWNNEGIGWSAPTSGTAVYRVYNPNVPGGDHYYTASSYEAKSLVKSGWLSDNGGKPVFYSGGKTPVYVAFNPNATASGSHNYTSNVFEQNSLLSRGWKFGKIQFYGQ